MFVWKKINSIGMPIAAIKVKFNGGQESAMSQKGAQNMHSLQIIKKLNQDAQDKFEGKEVIIIKPDLEKKTVSRTAWFEKKRDETE